MLSNDEKIKVLELRKKGYGYKSISGILKVKRDDVRGLCKRNGLDGFLGSGECSSKKTKVEKVNFLEECLSCNIPINKIEKVGRKAKFCSEKCRRDWWKNNSDKKVKNESAWYFYKCLYCGKEFSAYGNSHRKYCSVRCSIDYRFGDFKEITGGHGIIESSNK